LASVLVVAGWGYFLIQGVRDPLGGINSLWPLFGIANQLLAAIALCLGTTVLLKMALQSRTAEPGSRKSPALALITLVPLLWLLSVTFTAGWQKMFHESPRIGFLAAVRDYDQKLPGLKTAPAQTGAPAAAEKALKSAEALRFNNALDLGVTGVFLALAAAVVLVSVGIWIRLLAGARQPDLRETEPVWLPEHALREGKPLGTIGGTAALALALAKEWSGEAGVDRAQAQACECVGPAVLVNLPEVRAAVEFEDRQRAYVAAAEQRFEGVNRCC
jgi:carbon starvation protein